jgi:MFS family permease
MRSAFPLYLAGLGSWFVPLGIQMVLFSWLAAIVLHMDAFAVGIAQVALMAPGIVFLPLGGLVADRGNPRRLLLLYHFLYAVPPLVLGGMLAIGGLSYPLLIAYGLAAGSIGAFAVPTRDALLPAVARGNLPRAVALATALQFMGQLIGIACASHGRSYRGTAAAGYPCLPGADRRRRGVAAAQPAAASAHRASELLAQHRRRHRRGRALGADLARPVAQFWHRRFLRRSVHGSAAARRA